MQIEAQHYPGKIERRDVNDWLDRGDKIIQDVEDKVSKVGCPFHICVAKYLDEKTGKMKEIIDEGEKYTKLDAILVVDDLSRKGVAVPTSELQGRDATKAEILGYLMEDKIIRIGVCGLGGIGKTIIIKHVHNELLNRVTKFKKVVSVTATRQFDIIKLQKDIASQLKVSLPDEDETMRAAVLLEIRKLIECWIEEGFIAPMETRHKMNCQGHAILRTLEDNCLLEIVHTMQSRVIDDEDENAVKMHDLLKAMALDITSKSPRFLVKFGMKIRELPNKKQWTEDLKRVSLTRNSIEEILRDLSSPECQMLTTLLLSHNNLSNFPDSFFEQMNELKILDLSKNYELKSLPSSISELKNLTTLLLIGCQQLRKVLALSNCQAITTLDFNQSGIEEIPEGIEMLVNLKYLDLNYTNMRKLPEGMLQKLTCLQILALRISGIQVKGEVLWPLEKLEYFDGVLIDWNELSIFLKVMQSRRERLRDYRLDIGSRGEGTFEYQKHWKRLF
ncbi:hypothetical protein SLEP1_g42848 [Rubroshorea leprosula]|uniref:NB-ARC domain-containing protein n=1 Tax=Rubroshorea leprosula TaxID=152421 RepID=A0AAV5LB55_9ROSI|nr:hypothetical protein SLEP1_g42848 [Rubroshorea leprosula]